MTSASIFTEVLLPDSDLAAVLQAVAVLAFMVSGAIVLRRRGHAEAALLTLGVGSVCMGWFGLRAVH